MAAKLRSADTTLVSPCIVFALSRESMYIRRAYPVHIPILGAPCHAQFCRPRGSDFHRCIHNVVMLETGVGEAAMRTALSWCLSRPRIAWACYRPPFVLSAGFSGALSPEQRVGDLVLATEVVDELGHHWPARHDFACKDPKITLGRVLSAREMVSDPCEKQRLGQQYDAIAVDMESAVAARLCHEHDVPFLCLRVISDDRKTALSPHLVRLLQRGRISLPRLTAMVLKHPTLIGELMRLAANTRIAAKQLLAVGSLLEGVQVRGADSDKEAALREQHRIADPSRR
jgi:adenosylhomocysteine nucleosidase